MSDRTAFFNLAARASRGGSSSTHDAKIFTNPNQQATEDYITGRFG